MCGIHHPPNVHVVYNMNIRLIRSANAIGIYNQKGEPAVYPVCNSRFTTFTLIRNGTVGLNGSNPGAAAAHAHV